MMSISTTWIYQLWKWNRLDFHFSRSKLHLD